jgi:hypothetical protein
VATCETQPLVDAEGRSVWPALERLLPLGVPWRGVHDLLGYSLPNTSQPDINKPDIKKSGGDPSARQLDERSAWCAPLGVLLAFVHHLLPLFGRDPVRNMRRRIVWIGRRVWPSQRSLIAGARAGRPSLDLLHEKSAGDEPPITSCAGLASPIGHPSSACLEQSIFIDPTEHARQVPARRSADQRSSQGGPRSRRIGPPSPSANSSSLRAWVIEQAIRSEGIGIVIADGSGCSRAVSRSLHLAAAARATPCLVLLVRPPWEEQVPSSALIRWAAQPMPTSSWPPRWGLMLRRCRASVLPLLSEGARAVLRAQDAETTPPTHLEPTWESGGETSDRARRAESVGQPIGSLVEHLTLRTQPCTAGDPSWKEAS